MKRVWQTSATVFAGLLVTAMYAKPQAYTVSARPGGINYIEGQTYRNGQTLSDEGLKSVFLNANDTLSTDAGKAEILLTPGVFLRVGENSQIRMISPSLTNTQVEVNRGEAMIEADGLVKDNNIQVIDHGASVTIEKNGLYRFTADNAPTAAVIDGKAEVYFGDKKIDLAKGHETILSDVLKPEKFDSKKADDLYAWSNVRSEYDAATSYQTAKNVSMNNYDAFGGYGFGSFYGPGWYWDNAFDSWGWMPGEGAFFSPFGYGFYGAGYLPYAPVIVAPVYGRGGSWQNGHWTGHGGRTAPVPVNPSNPPALGATASSPWANHVVRAQAAQAFAAQGGFRTAAGAPAASFTRPGRSGVARPSGFSGGHPGGSGGVAHPAYSGGVGAHPAYSGGGGGGHAGGSGGGGHR